MLSLFCCSCWASYNECQPVDSMLALNSLLFVNVLQVVYSPSEKHRFQVENSCPRVKRTIDTRAVGEGWLMQWKGIACIMVGRLKFYRNIKPYRVKWSSIRRRGINTYLFTLWEPELLWKKRYILVEVLARFQNCSW